MGINNTEKKYFAKEVFSCECYSTWNPQTYPDKKENRIFLIYMEIQKGAVAKSYITNGFLIYFLIYWNPFHTYDLATAPIWSSLYTRNFFLFLSVYRKHFWGSSYYILIFNYVPVRAGRLELCMVEDECVLSWIRLVEEDKTGRTVVHLRVKGTVTRQYI